MKEDRQITKEFAEAIEHYMRKRGLTYRNLSDETGISSAYLCRIRNQIRQAPSVPVAVKLFKTLKIPKDQVLALLDLDEEEDQGQTDLNELLLFYDYTLNEREVSLEVKRKLIDLIQFVVNCELSKKSLAFDLVTLSQKISEFQEELKF